MARHTISITNGKGSIELIDGQYSATALVQGYDATTLYPKNVTLVEGTNNYEFKIAANGTLTLHVTDTGESTGSAVFGSTFVRTDASGTVYGDPVTTGSDGNAVFNNVPFSASGNITIYYKQISGDGGHTFDTAVKSTVMTTESQVVEIENPSAPERNFTLMDASFPNIPIIDGQIILEDN